MQQQHQTMPGNFYNCPIDKLDTPCLVRVLQYVSPQQQLVVCGAVCSKWREATREAISSIAVQKCTEEKCDQLQQWAVLPPAALYRLSLHLRVCRLQPGLRLQLSMLQHLRDLELHSVRLEAVAADGSVLEVADLLPRLHHCTKLAYAACHEDGLFPAAVAAFKDMPALQDLELICHDLPALNLAALPTTLTRLCLTDAPCIDSTSAAGFSQLTGLRVLEATASGCDTSVLVRCSSLERVVLDVGVGAGLMFSGEDGFNTPLLVFANMPSLQHLALQSVYGGPVATAAEVAALSASSNLTYLSLGDGEYYALPAAAYDSWFPPGCQCSQAVTQQAAGPAVPLMCGVRCMLWSWAQLLRKQSSRLDAFKRSNSASMHVSKSSWSGRKLLRQRLQHSRKSRLQQRPTLQLYVSSTPKHRQRLLRCSMSRPRHRPRLQHFRNNRQQSRQRLEHSYRSSSRLRRHCCVNGFRSSKWRWQPCATSAGSSSPMQRRVRHRSPSCRARLHRCRPLWLHCWSARADSEAGMSRGLVQVCFVLMSTICVRPSSVRPMGWRCSKASPLGTVAHG